MKTTEHGLMLIAGTALWFDRSLDEQQRQDAIDSILYAQLLANQKADSRFEHPEAWHKVYRETYVHLEWSRLANVYDQKVMGQAAENTQVQALEEWFELRKIDYQAVLNGISERLEQDANAFRHCLKFCSREQSQHVDLVIELGVLSSGPTLELCSLALRTARPLPGSSLITLLQGEVTFRGLSLTLDNERFANTRDKLHDLIMQKQSKDRLCYDLDAPPEGDEHE